MMEKQVRKMLVPQYMHQFSCIGSECEDSCCIGWRVVIDQDTYKKYNQVRDYRMKPLLSKNVKRNRSNPSKENFAKIAMDSKGCCPMLNEDKLCTVQKNLGESYLSNVCATYPRTSNVVNDVVEMSATLSCPEIARLSLLNPEGIQFDEVEQSSTERTIKGKVIRTDEPQAADKLEGYFWELRIFTIQVLQDRSYSMADRLILLGMFYKKLQEKIEGNRMGDIPNLILFYTEIREDGSLREQLANIPVHTTIQMQLLKEIIDQRFALGNINSTRYLECFTEFLNGIEYTADKTIKEIGLTYKEVYDECYVPFMEKHEHVFENYLVNYVFRTLFPLLKNNSVYDEYVLLILHYSLIKLMLIGMAGFHREKFNMDHVIKLIQSFAKVLEHNQFYFKKSMDLLEKNGYKDVAYMSIIVKN